MESATAAWSVRAIATVTGATAFVRTRRLEIGVPLQFDPTYAGVSALEHALAAVGADVLACFAVVSKRERLVIEHAEAIVRATLEQPLAYLGVIGEAGTPAIDRLEVRAHVATFAAEDAVQRAWVQALARSPLAATFGRLARFTATIEITH